MGLAARIDICRCILAPLVRLETQTMLELLPNPRQALAGKIRESRGETRFFEGLVLRCMKGQKPTVQRLSRGRRWWRWQYGT